MWCLVAASMVAGQSAACMRCFCMLHIYVLSMGLVVQLGGWVEAESTNHKRNVSYILRGQPPLSVYRTLRGRLHYLAVGPPSAFSLPYTEKPPPLSVCFSHDGKWRALRGHPHFSTPNAVNPEFLPLVAAQATRTHLFLSS